MPMPKTMPLDVPIAPVRKRLSRERSKARTRAQLLKVGRDHILRDGLGDAATERIAEDAGYSRGAFYSNFLDKEDLFLTIIQEEEAARFEALRSVIQKDKDIETLLRDLREAFADRVMDPDWIRLHAEFQATALRSERARRAYAEIHQQILRDGRRLIQMVSEAPGIRFTLKSEDLLMTMLAFCQGLAVNQRLLGSASRSTSTRRLIYSVFDHFITRA